MGLEKWGRCEKFTPGKIRKVSVIYSNAASLPMPFSLHVHSDPFIHEDRFCPERQLKKWCACGRKPEAQAANLHDVRISQEVGPGDRQGDLLTPQSWTLIGRALIFGGIKQILSCLQNLSHIFSAEKFVQIHKVLKYFFLKSELDQKFL